MLAPGERRQFKKPNETKYKTWIKMFLYKKNPVYEWFKMIGVVFKVDPVKPEGWSVSGTME